MFNPDKFNWRIFDPSEQIPSYVSIWLLDSTSLTQKLKEKYEDFEVNVISQKESMPYKCEHQLVNSPEN